METLTLLLLSQNPKLPHGAFQINMKLLLIEFPNKLRIPQQRFKLGSGDLPESLSVILVKDSPPMVIQKEIV